MSTAETNKVKAKLAALVASFDDLEAQLEPLFAQTLPETLVGLEPLQQAKLQTVLPYLVYDLIFIYLKSKGIDPRTHPVIGELDRIRQYFEKISNAENPPARRTEVDKGAANRFIKHAIAQSQAQWKKTAAEEMQTQPTSSPSSSSKPTPSSSSKSKSKPAQASASAPAERPPVKVTEKMRARAEYEAQLKVARENGMDEDDGPELQLFDEEDGGDGGQVGEDVQMDVDVDEEEEASSKGKGKGKGKGKAKAKAEEGEGEEASGETTGGKRRRPVLDPFAGYGDDATAAPAAHSPAPPTASKKAKSASSKSSTSTGSKTKKKSKKTAASS